MGRSKSAKSLALIEAVRQPAADGALELDAFRLTRTGLEVTLGVVVDDPHEAAA